MKMAFYGLRIYMILLPHQMYPTLDHPIFNKNFNKNNIIKTEKKKKKEEEEEEEK